MTKIKISKDEHIRMETFVEVMKEAAASKYNEEHRHISMTEEILTNTVIKSELPNEESTSHICSKIRPFLLTDDHYSKIIKILRDLIGIEPDAQKEKHESQLLKSEKILKENYKHKELNTFTLYMYGKYVKADSDKREIIKQMPHMLEVGFHKSLGLVFRALVNLANLYEFLKKEHSFEVTESEPRKTTRTFGI
ncbi:hypothetical protein IPG41_00410 [Candidatus Peregrinibacteria bacterium]|nr:MAG: hypothetical protein IPG41_00410 [Candidatus Peregrinibacteria bacterium]